MIEVLWRKRKRKSLFTASSKMVAPESTRLALFLHLSSNSFSPVEKNCALGGQKVENDIGGEEEEDADFDLSLSLHNLFPLSFSLLTFYCAFLERDPFCFGRARGKKLGFLFGTVGGDDDIREEAKLMTKEAFLAKCVISSGEVDPVRVVGGPLRPFLRYWLTRHHRDWGKD